MQISQILRLGAAAGGVVVTHRLAYRLKRVRTMSHFEERVWGVGVPMLALTLLLADDKLSGREALLSGWALFGAAGAGYLLLQAEDKRDHEQGRDALKVERWLSDAISGRDSTAGNGAGRTGARGTRDYQ